MYFTPPLARLIEEFQKFPGVGPKSAQRMAFFVLNMSTQDVANLSRVLVDAKDKVKHCSNCFHLSANDPCEICTNDKRDIKTICVVADSRDVIALEKTREYKGSYHVLNGLISPLEGRGPEQLRVRELLQRTGSQEPKEIILAINPTIEGDATVLYLSSLLKPLSIKITRIAFGLPVGSDLEFADEVTLTRALEGRREV
ncbi:MAG: recombination protein RecR [Candidatus Obscuribacter sp.]|jgi:recombination protein RecR|nr:recombination protein RecR [Candidatus Obscuribacter sp.]MDQ5966961.1 Recombination protein RecR [Cyanobacteriota bacterium erpe_2018_sw_39hr_WHONDRS-SW48-000098_B_bin.30]MBK9202274.1 recombination protein RecR [Candidatus Obscuribacter sp.]MBK9618944.1 recombination protein RecR [Candidatus Obscuribacter sp.]MBK9769662.1 recombination protein RecR [Candidatus Obscuribacter sp.]